MNSPEGDTLVPIPVDQPVWDRFFMIAPLVVVGSRGVEGEYDLAPKHMAMPLGWRNHYCFVCSPRHRTYQNIVATREFTVSFPRPSQVLLTSLAAVARSADQSKPSLQLLPTTPATKVDGILVGDCYLYLECALHSIHDGFGANSLIIGEVVAASARESMLRRDERDEGEQIFSDPLLAYVSPGRMAEIRRTTAFPFPKYFSR